MLKYEKINDKYSPEIDQHFKLLLAVNSVTE